MCSCSHFLTTASLFDQGGIYFFQLVDHYTASISIMYLAFFEVVGVAWLYGAGRLARNVRDMTGRMPGLYMRACWWFVSPVTLLVSGTNPACQVARAARLLQIRSLQER